MSRVTLSIYGFRQRFDEQFEELLGRQGVERFPEYAVHLRPEQFELRDYMANSICSEIKGLS